MLASCLRDHPGTTTAEDSKRESAGARWASFFKSGPGVLTAIATLIAAVTGLVTALTTLGGGSSGSSPPTAFVATATTVIVDESASQRELRSHISAAIQPSCGAPVDPEAGSVAAFNCKYRDIVGLQYNLYASSREARDAFEAVKQRYDLGQANGRACDAGDYAGQYRSGGRTGERLCFVKNGTASIVWTENGLDILSFAWRADANLPALADAWQNGAGP